MFASTTRLVLVVRLAQYTPPPALLAKPDLFMAYFTYWADSIPVHYIYEYGSGQVPDTSLVCTYDVRNVDHVCLVRSV